MTSRVQTRLTPPVLQPLKNPESQPLPRIHKRIKLIHEYAERYRELDLSEARELLDLKYLLEHGTLPPVGGTLRVPKKYTPQLEDLLA